MALPHLQDGVVISEKVNHSVLLRKTVTPKPEYTRLHLPPVSTTLALLPVIQSSICLDPTLCPDWLGKTCQKLKLPSVQLSGLWDHKSPTANTRLVIFRIINVINTDIYFSLSLSQKKVYKPYISLIIQGKVTCNVYNAIHHIYVIFIWNIIQQNLVDYFVCLLSLLSCWILFREYTTSRYTDISV